MQRMEIVFRENHRLGNPYGSQVQVGADTGMGWNFPTCQKPIPVGQVVHVGMGFFSGPLLLLMMTSDSLL